MTPLMIVVVIGLLCTIIIGAVEVDRLDSRLKELEHQIDRLIKDKIS